jgi:hypothetical protein
MFRAAESQREGVHVAEATLDKWDVLHGGSGGGGGGFYHCW